MAHYNLSVIDRFMSHVEMITESGCWIWMAGLDGKGYGMFGFGARPGKKLSEGSVMHRAHRFGYGLMRGPVPDDMDIDHLCRVRCCVNPWHLEVVTHRENCLRGTATEINTARNRAKTHCPRGHEYSPENTFVTQGGRKCRACFRIFNREARARKKALLHSGADLALEKIKPGASGRI